MNNENNIIRNALLSEGQVLVWIGKFTNKKNQDVVNEGYGLSLIHI